MTERSIRVQGEAFRIKIESYAFQAKRLLIEAVQEYKRIKEDFPSEHFVYDAPLNTTNSRDIKPEEAFYISHENLDEGRLGHVMLMPDNSLRRYFSRKYLPKDKDGDKRNKPNYDGNVYQDLSDLDYVIWAPKAIRRIADELGQ